MCTNEPSCVGYLFKNQFGKDNCDFFGSIDENYIKFYAPGTCYLNKARNNGTFPPIPAPTLAPIPAPTPAPIPAPTPAPISSHLHSGSGQGSTIGGGSNNEASGKRSTVGGGAFNKASGTKSTIAGGTYNKAIGTGSFIGGGSDNESFGTYSVVIGGSSNLASGENTIAMGTKAIAKHDLSLVINLGTKEATSTKQGEFLVSSKSFYVKSKNSFAVTSRSFTFRIGGKKAIINKNNIRNFIDLLNKKSRRLEQNDEQQKQIDEQQSNNDELHKQIDEQNNNYQEQIDELHHMMADLIA